MIEEKKCPNSSPVQHGPVRSGRVWAVCQSSRIESVAFCKRNLLLSASACGSCLSLSLSEQGCLLNDARSLGVERQHRLLKVKVVTHTPTLALWNR